jgi:hypothetical protein
MSAVNNNSNASAVSLMPLIPAAKIENAKMGMADKVTSERHQDGGVIQSVASQPPNVTMTELKPVAQAAYYPQGQCVPLYSQYYSEYSYLRNY